MGGTALLGARLLLGGYLAAHGAQKLFGKFGGYGIQGTGGLFDSVGLTPGPEMARLAGITELTGGVLTATGALHPLGPVAVAGAMTVAVPFQRAGGPFAPNGFELPLTNLAIATALAASDPGKLRLGPRLPKKLAAVSILGAAVIGGYLANKVASFQPAGSEVDLTTQTDGADQTEAAELGTA